MLGADVRLAIPRLGSTSSLEAIARQAVEHEAELRAMLRLSLEPNAPEHATIFRSASGGASAGSPTRSRRCVAGFPSVSSERLVLAIASAVGIDALVWLTDIAGLSRPQAVEQMRWSARALLKAALADHTDLDSAAD